MTVNDVLLVVDDFLVRKRRDGLEPVFHVFGDSDKCCVSNEDFTEILEVPSNSFDFKPLMDFLEKFSSHIRHYVFLEVA